VPGWSSETNEWEVPRVASIPSRIEQASLTAIEPAPPNKPANDPPVLGMLRPSPRDQHIYVKEVSHGKSTSISRTFLVVSGGVPAGEENILAPVFAQRTRLNLPGLPRASTIRPRIYCETVILLPRASSRIRRASSVDTLKVMVAIVIP